MNNPTFYYFIISSFLLVCTAHAEQSCKWMVAYGYPTTQYDGQLLCRQQYVLSYSADTKTAFWSAEKLIGQDQNIPQERINAFKSDPNVPNSPKLSDYAKSGWDKGHLAPVGDMHSSTSAMLESFYLTNMIPQSPENNRIIWRMLEEYVRQQSILHHELFVITGPIYADPISTVAKIGKSKIAVPTHIFKVLFDPTTSTALSFVIPNIPVKTNEPLSGFVSSIPLIEEMTKIRLFPNATQVITDSLNIW